MGSGVIYDSNGWILTNRHVVEGGNEFQVELKDGRVLAGEVYGIDTLTDLAIVKVDATDLPTAAVGVSDALEVGQLVIAIGSPLGTYSNSVTSGIVSAKGRTITTDGSSTAADQPDPDGCGDQPRELRRPAPRRERQRRRDQHRHRHQQQRDRVRHPDRRRAADHGPGRRRSGARAAVPRDPVREHHPPARRRGEPAGPGGRARRRPRPERPGRSPGVQPGTPAAKAGIKDGDIIMSVGGKAIDDGHPLDATLAQFSPGQTVNVEDPARRRDDHARGDAGDATGRPQ